MHPDIIIIGGGLMGVCSAFNLAKAGFRCLILEKQHPGRHASGVNAGGLRSLNRHPAEIPLSVEAAKIWHAITDLLDNDCDARFPGQIRVAENQQDLEKLNERAALVRSLGFQHEQIIDSDELFEWVPALSRHCVGAIICRDDGYARPYHALTAFRRKAQALGVKIISDEAVLKLEPGNPWKITGQSGNYEAPIIVNCAGAWAGTIAAQVDEHVPLIPKAPMLMITERLPHFIDPVLGAASRKLSFKQMQNGTLMIGGAHLAKLDFEQETTEMDWLKLAESASTVLTLFPQLQNVRIVRTWAGIEAFMPDNLPVISASQVHENLFHAFGFSAHGFQLSPVVGEIMAELVVDKKSRFAIEAFNIGRF